jgi:hypothetical protein
MNTRAMSKLPVALFVISVFGLVFFGWHSYNYLKLRDAQIAAAEFLQKQHSDLVEKISELERKRLVTKVEYSEHVVKVENPSWASHNIIGGLFSLDGKKPTKTVRMKVPKEVKTEDPAVKEEIQTSRKHLQEADSALEKKQEELTVADKIFGIRREIATFVFSLLILLSSLYVILIKKFHQSTEKWAFGSLGTILGYGLK